MASRICWSSWGQLISTVLRDHASSLWHHRTLRPDLLTASGRSFSSCRLRYTPLDNVPTKSGQRGWLRPTLAKKYLKEIFEMDSGTVVVLGLMLAAAVFLVYAERNSRRNVAKLKAESGGAITPPGLPSDIQEQKPGNRKSA
jgi:hypothetical protein